VKSARLSATLYPSDRQVVDVMDAAGGATETQVIQCLCYLRVERGLLPGTKHGPRRFGWFKTVVADYVHRKKEREAVYSPPAGNDTSRLSQAEIDSMTDAIEIDMPLVAPGDDSKRPDQPTRGI
jgi:hypothetical protein